MQLLLCNLWFTISPCLSSKKPKTFTQWRDALKDRVAAARITARLDKLHFGHFGDVKPVGEGVWEMKINVGAGYRAYYVLRDGALILFCYAAVINARKAAILKKQLPSTMQ